MNYVHEAIQVMFDEKLLRELGRDAEVKRDGRSAVLRRAAAAYLRQKRRTEIRAAYERAYGPKAGKDIQAAHDQDGDAVATSTALTEAPVFLELTD